MVVPKAFDLAHIEVYRFPHRLVLIDCTGGVVERLEIDRALDKLGGTDHDAKRFFQSRNRSAQGWSSENIYQSPCFSEIGRF